MKNDYPAARAGGIRSLLLVTMMIAATGCGSNAQKGAAEGAATGAMAGAVGGMFTALIFGGNVAEAGARGAVYGGSSGAVVGGISGSRADQAEAAQQQAARDAELASLRTRIGDDAFNGLVALTECKHDVAIANAREAAKSGNKDFSLAGVWVEVLTEADRQREAEAHSLFPEIVSRDRNIKTDADAQAYLTRLLNQLHDARVAYNKPAVCSV